jgi:hypothetical protein
MLDTWRQGYFRMVVQGREFVRNDTDVVRIYLDTKKGNSGPEYSYDWFLGKNPAANVGANALFRVDAWDAGGAPAVPCTGLGHKISFGTDQITISIPRRCIGMPAHVRWAGFVGTITRYKPGVMYGHYDDFPAENTFPGFWAG